MELTLVPRYAAMFPPGLYYRLIRQAFRGDWTGIFMGPLGFGIHELGTNYTYGFYWDLYGYGVAVPDWFLMLMTALLPIRWIITARKLRRLRKLGYFCRHCGYNLTGNVSGICPECGKQVGGKEGVKA